MPRRAIVRRISPFYKGEHKGVNCNKIHHSKIYHPCPLLKIRRGCSIASVFQKEIKFVISNVL
jgi:hypothetical protein